MPTTNKLEREEMRIYKDLKKYIDNNLKKGADSFNNLEEYYLFCRMNQMYNELFQIKLSYKKVLEKDFKKTLIQKMYQVRQNLYNTISSTCTKKELIEGIQYAIKYLNEILEIGKKDEKK